MNMFLMNSGAIAAIVVVAVIVIILAWYIGVLNKIRTMLVKVDESESGIDVALTKRFDLLTKMVSTVKGYAKHESETLTKVIGMRQPAKGASVTEKADFANKLNAASREINVVVERYPDLKANQNFLGLQSSISEVEEQLQAARRVYNANVSSYNQFIVVFPNSIVAGGKYTKRDFFEADEAKKADVDIQF